MVLPKTGLISPFFFDIDVELELKGKEETAIRNKQLRFVFYEGVHNGREFKVTITHLMQGRTYKREFAEDIAEIENGITANMEEFAGIVKSMVPKKRKKDTVIEY